MTGVTTACRTVSVVANGSAVEVPVDDERFVATVRLTPGENRVTARCDVDSPGTASSDTLVYRTRLPARPVARVALSLSGGKVVLDGRASSPNVATSAKIASYSWTLVTEEGRRRSLPASDARVAVARPRADGDYRVSLRVIDDDGVEDVGFAAFVVEDGRARKVDVLRANPAWTEDAVVYGVIPRLFGNDGFRAVTARLGYLERLGVNALWLSPVNPSPPGDFGYAVVDYFGVNPDYGTEEDFRRLIDEAHRRGIRVLMDFVPNHTSVEHPYFRDVTAHGERSRYRDFYQWQEWGEPVYYFDWQHLPNLNYDNREVERMMTEAFSYWVREFDVDGYRVDVAWGVQYRDPKFWPRLRRELHRIKPDVLLIAEASARDRYFFTHGFDAAYDWTKKLGNWAWDGIFASERRVAERLHAALTNRGKGLHPDAVVFRFLNNNDTGPRFVGEHGPATTRVAAALLLTAPGIPCVYTGDEVGELYLPYSDGVPISWRDAFGLRSYYRRLIRLRRSVPSLHSRAWTPAPVEGEPGAYAYVRHNEAGEDPVLVVLNFGAKPIRARLRLPARFSSLVERPLRDVLAERPIRPSDRRISVGAASARILVPEAA